MTGAPTLDIVSLHVTREPAIEQAVNIYRATGLLPVYGVLLLGAILPSSDLLNLKSVSHLWDTPVMAGSKHWLVVVKVAEDASTYTESHSATGLNHGTYGEFEAG